MEESSKKLTFRQSLSWADFFVSLAVLIVGIPLCFWGLSVLAPLATPDPLDFLFILLGLIGSILIFGWPILKGVRHGWMKLLFIVMSYIIWLVIATFAFGSLLSKNSPYQNQTGGQEDTNEIVPL